jgi:hypothetical protein
MMYFYRFWLRHNYLVRISVFITVEFHISNIIKFAGGYTVTSVLLIN